jgi:hypothetical protein
MAGKIAGQGLLSAFSGEINYLTDTIKAMLTTSAYTFDPLTHRYKSSVTNEVSGTGYTARGATLAGKAATYTAANSFGTSRANSTPYVVGDVFRPATGNLFLYQVVAAGTSAASPPTFPTVIGDTVADGTARISCVGIGIFVLNATDPTWPASSITARTVVIYKDTGTDGTSPIIFADTLPADVISSSGTWTYDIPTLGFGYFFDQI